MKARAGQLERAKPEWLTLERACFGFRASAGGKSFSFDRIKIVLALLSDNQHEGFLLEIDSERLQINVLKGPAKESKGAYSLDDLLEFEDGDGTTKRAVAPQLKELGNPSKISVNVRIIADQLFATVRSAVDQGFARVFARIDSPLATQFTELAADSFRAFTVRNFHIGYAQALDGSRLFSIHIEPQNPEQAKSGEPPELPPKQASLARFILAKHGGRWPDSEWKPLLIAFGQWINVQTGERTSIGRSSAAALKKRFPQGFLIEGRPLDKIAHAPDTVAQPKM